MLESAKIKLLTSLIGCIAVVLLVFSTFALAQQLYDEGTLQPQGLNNAGVYAVRQIEPDLTGSGVNLAVICRSITYLNGEPQDDYRPFIEHECFKAEKFSFHDRGQLPAGISPHSTAICSILFGEDPNAFTPSLGQFYYQGAAPAADVDIYEFWHFLINNIYAHTPPDAEIVTAGIGSQFEDWWTRGIDALAEHYGLIIVAGIGNGSNSYDPPLYPGAAANVIGVGVVNSVNTEDPVTNLAHFSLAYPENSSFGPTIDGRCKPDIVAPGNCLAAGVTELNGYELTGNWSSFSTPVTAGAIALLVQKAKQDVDLNLAVSPDGGNCVIKAILMNSATKLPYWHKGRLRNEDDHIVPLDYVQGAGMLNTVSAYWHLTAGRYEPGDVQTMGWDLNQLDKDKELGNIYRIKVDDPKDKLITITLAWNRPYKHVYPFERISAKDNDLRLELWAVDPANSDNDYLLDYCDSKVDNVEHIYCQADNNFSDYEVVVAYSDGENLPPLNVKQRYSLAWNIGSRQDAGDDIFWHDLNADGVVNESDFAILLNNWVAGARSPDRYLLGDINTDGAIDVNDVQIFLDNNERQAHWHVELNDKPST
jgi:hypothetical protein